MNLIFIFPPIHRIVNFKQDGVFFWQLNHLFDDAVVPKDIVYVHIAFPYVGQAVQIVNKDANP